jgi:hypothetical protein
MLGADAWIIEPGRDRMALLWHRNIAVDIVGNLIWLRGLML